MSAPLAIRSGAWAAGIAPAYGGAVLSLKRGDSDILRPGAPGRVAADPRAAASFVCVPWFGRLVGGLAFAGRRWPLTPTLAACDPVHALHGEGWVRPWRIAAHTDDRAVLVFEHGAGAFGRFPFAFSAEQEIRLDANGATHALAVRNDGDATMPAGLGLHPYFPRRRTTRLALAAARLWTPPRNGAEGSDGAIPADLDFSLPAPLPERGADHTFTGVSGAASVAQPDIALRLETDAPFLHLYAPEGEDFFCLEPVTHLPGRFGEDTLAPGETLRVTLRIEADPAPGAA
jgi:aldose 1-epimerase